MKPSVFASALIVLAALVVRAPAFQDPDPPEPAPFEAFELSALLERKQLQEGPWLRFLERPSMSCGVYRLKAGSEDKQSPHALDELYYAVSGQGRFTVGAESCDVSAGSLLFVAANEPHRFHDIEEELVLIVVFSKAAQPEK